MVFKGNLPIEMSIYLKYLHHDQQIPISKLSQRFPHISRATIYRHVRETVEESITQNKKAKKNAGRKKLRTKRDERKILLQVIKLRESDSNFTSKRIKHEAGVHHLSDRTLRRILNLNDYFYLQTRKKGLLSSLDLMKRARFASNMLRNYNEKVWTEEISFYLDATSFVHKTNPHDQARAPKGRVWRKHSEGLQQGCTSKGSKVGHGGRVVHLMVAISYGKGVIICEQYQKMNGEYFKSFIDENFNNLFKIADKLKRLFVQDGDPSQNSKIACDAWESSGARLLKIPPRSPDINPIENVFHLVEKKLTKEALKFGIKQENYEQFSKRVINTINNFDKEKINNIIQSMNKRMKQIRRNNGKRLKY